MEVNLLLLLQALCFSVLMTAAAVTDLRARIIPDTLCVGVALTGLIAFEPQNLAGFLIAVFPLTIARFFGGIEGGDIKLMAAAGLVLGFQQSLAAVIFGFTAFSIFAFIHIIIRKVQGEDMRRVGYPLAPFLTFGFLMVYFFF